MRDCDEDDKPQYQQDLKTTNRAGDPIYRRVWKAQRQSPSFEAHQEYLKRVDCLLRDEASTEGLDPPNHVLDFATPSKFAMIEKVHIDDTSLEGDVAAAFGIKGKPGFVFLPNVLSRDEEADFVVRSCVEYAVDTSISETNLQRIASKDEIEYLFKTSGPCTSVNSSNSRNDCAAQMHARNGECAPNQSDGCDNCAKVTCSATTDRYNSEQSAKEPMTSERRRHLWKKLKWATLGYHFDWNERAYVRGRKSEMPTQLVNLAARLTKVGGYSIRPETAIVNFYGKGANMGAHKDDSELAPDAPVLSVTFGCPAIFVLGGDTLDDEPVAMYVRGGDAMLLGGPSRHAIHGVPCAFPMCRSLGFESALEAATATAAEQHPDTSRDLLLEFSKMVRVNINVRQVFPREEDALDGEPGELVSSNPDWRKQYIGMGMGKT